jgi:hypothetical protein
VTRRLRVPHWILLGLLVRLILSPLNHPWDLQTWYNMFGDLARDRSPYETFHDLTASYRADMGLMEPRNTPNAEVQPAFYAYYAYPPLLMILYYPVAKVAGRVIPLEPQFTFHGPAASVVVPPLFNLFFKVPLFLAELGIVAVLWRAAGEPAARRFFLNPLIILVSATWTFEALMAYPVLLSILFLREGRYAAAGALVAAGALIKFIPAILVPAVLIVMWQRGASWKQMAAFAGTFAAVCAVVIAPFWRAVHEVTLFQAVRPGANLTLHFLMYPLRQFAHTDIRFLAYVVSPVVGVVTQTAALVLTYSYLARRAHSVTQAFIITLVAFFLGSKIVNEPYPYVLVPLLLLELREHPSEAKSAGLKLLYALPLAFAFLNVPIVYMAAPLYRYFWTGNYPVSYEWSRALPLGEHSAMLSVFMLAFVAASVYVLRTMTRREPDGQELAATH